MEPRNHRWHRGPLGRLDGFTLVEMMVAIGITMAIALGAMEILQHAVGSASRTESKQTFLESTNFIRNNLNRHGSAFGCSQILSIPGTFQPGGETPVAINIDQLHLSDGAQIKGAKPFRINRIFLSNADRVVSNSATTTYVATLYIDGSAYGSSGYSDSTKTELSTVVINVDSAGHFTNCDMGEVLEDSVNLCNAISGMAFNPSSGKCETVIATNANGLFTQCPSGAAPAGDGSCPQAPSGCSNAQIAAGFGTGIVGGCSTPAGYTVLPIGQSPTPGGGTPATTPPAPTSCQCGNTAVGIGGFCASCDKDSGFLIFTHAKWDYQVYQCGTDGNLAYMTEYKTQDSPPTCQRVPRPANCDGSGNGCQQVP